MKMSFGMKKKKTLPFYNVLIENSEIKKLTHRIIA